MARGISLEMAGVISTSLEATLYGISLVLFGGTMFILVKRRIGPRVNMKMVVVACTLLALSTAHLVMDIQRLIDGLILRRDAYPTGPEGYLGDVARPTFMAKNAVYTAQTLIADGVVIYRCYKVWRTLWIIILPSLGWCAVLVCGVGSVYNCSKVTSDSVFSSITYHWITGFFVSSFITNFTATAILAFRIWKVDRSVAHTRLGHSRLRPTLLVVVDTGLVYSMALLAALGCFIARSNSQYIVLDMISPIISIAFYVVLTRVGIATHQHYTYRHQSTIPQRSRETAGQHSSKSKEEFGMTPMAVHITQFTEQHTDMDLQTEEGDLEGGKPSPMDQDTKKSWEARHAV